MNWKKQLSQVENILCTDNLQYMEDGTLELLENIINNYPNEIEANIRVIYVIHNQLVEGQYSPDEHDLLAILLKNTLMPPVKNFRKMQSTCFLLEKYYM